MDNSNIPWTTNSGPPIAELLFNGDNDDLDEHQQYLHDLLANNTNGIAGLESLNRLPASVMHAFMSTTPENTLPYSTTTTTSTTAATTSNTDATTTSRINDSLSILDFSSTRCQSETLRITPSSSQSSVLPIKTGKGRKAFACDVCRKRKVRCDLQRPSCSNCQKRNADCFYRTGTLSSRRTKSKKSSKSSDKASSPSHAANSKRSAVCKTNRNDRQTSSAYLTNLSSESAVDSDNLNIITFSAAGTPPLADHYPDDMAITSTSTTSTSTSTTFEQIWLHSPSISNASSISSVSTRGDSSVSPMLTPSELDQYISYYGSLQSPPNSPPQYDVGRINSVYGGGWDKQQYAASTISYTPGVSLSFEPSPELVQHLIAMYISQITSQISFFTVGWLQKELLKGGVSRSLIYAIMAMTCRLYNSVITGVDPEALEKAMTDRAADILARYTGVPTVSTVQAAMMLQSVYICNGNAQAAGRYHYKSLKMLKVLDVNTPLESACDSNISEDHPDWDEVETRRRVWWFAYMLDRCVSVVSGNPPYLDHERSRILFPSDDVDLANSAVCTDEHAVNMEQQPGHTVRKTSGPFNWRARVLQILELQSDIARITNQLRDNNPQGVELELICQELNRLTAIFNRMGGHEKSLDTMDRLCRITIKLNNMSDDTSGARILKAYKVLFRVFAHCQHRCVQIMLGRAKMALLDMDSSGNNGIMILPAQGNSLTALYANGHDIEIRESIIHGALEIAELTRLIPDDLMCYMNAYHSYASGVAGFVFSDVANSSDDDYWPGIRPIDAIAHLQTLVSCLTLLSRTCQTLVTRRDMLKAMVIKAQARLVPALFDNMASQEILTTLPPVMDSAMLSSKVLTSMSATILGPDARSSPPMLSMPTDENSVVYKAADWKSSNGSRQTSPANGEQGTTPPPESDHYTC
ncbi:fungal-specific transcription factor domain-containing protein [Syncephalis plumigaleata]|nr:fungal-specific transcription factor domain-containing protein [Syncephalis plumigaleata]